MCSCISWMLLGAIYYGCSQYVGQISSNVFVTISLTGALKVPTVSSDHRHTYVGFISGQKHFQHFQIPIVLVSGYMYKRYGRRSTVIGLLVLTALCCGVLALPDDWFYTRLVAGILGVNFVAGAFTAM